MHPARIASFAAVVYRRDAIELLFLVDHPQGPDGLWFRTLYTARGEKTRQGPTGPVGVADWLREVDAVVFPVAMGEHRGGERRRAADDGAFQRFAAKGIHPRLESWSVVKTLDDTDVPCAGGKIEMWSAVVGGGSFVYPHLAAGIDRSGEIAVIVAAETMPSAHASVVLGLFADGGHKNLGEGPWADLDKFVEAAVPILSSRLVRTDPPSAPFPSRSVQVRGEIGAREPDGEATGAG